jgi:hypothetical protein
MKKKKCDKGKWELGRLSAVDDKLERLGCELEEGLRRKIPFEKHSFSVTKRIVRAIS